MPIHNYSRSTARQTPSPSATPSSHSTAGSKESKLAKIGRVAVNALNHLKAMLRRGLNKLNSWFFRLFPHTRHSTSDAASNLSARDIRQLEMPRTTIQRSHSFPNFAERSSKSLQRSHSVQILNENSELTTFDNQQENSSNQIGNLALSGNPAEQSNQELTSSQVNNASSDVEDSPQQSSTSLLPLSSEALETSSNGSLNRSQLDHQTEIKKSEGEEIEPELSLTDKSRKSAEDFWEVESSNDSLDQNLNLSPKSTDTESFNSTEANSDSAINAPVQNQLGDIENQKPKQENQPESDHAKQTGTRIQDSDVSEAVTKNDDSVQFVETHRRALTREEKGKQPLEVKRELFEDEPSSSSSEVESTAEKTQEFSFGHQTFMPIDESKYEYDDSRTLVKEKALQEREKVEGSKLISQIITPDESRQKVEDIFHGGTALYTDQAGLQKDNTTAQEISTSIIKIEEVSNKHLQSNVEPKSSSLKINDIQSSDISTDLVKKERDLNLSQSLSPLSLELPATELIEEAASTEEMSSIEEELISEYVEITKKESQSLFDLSFCFTSMLEKENLKKEVDFLLNDDDVKHKFKNLKLFSSNVQFIYNKKSGFWGGFESAMGSVGKLVGTSESPEKAMKKLWSEVLKEIRDVLNPNKFNVEIKMPEFRENDVIDTKQFKEDRCIKICEKLSYYLYKSNVLLPYADHTLEEYGIIENDDFSLPIYNQIENSAKRIKNLEKKLSETLTKEVKKLKSKFNFMDSNLHNIPFSAGFISYQALNEKENDYKFCQQLRHPTPTIEMGKIKIAQEYKAFIEMASEKGEKILYSNHQSINSFDERNRIESYTQLETQFSNFSLISLPVLKKIGDEKISDKKSFCDYLLKLFSDDDMQKKFGFYFSSNLNLKPDFLAKRSKIWIDFIHDHLLSEDEVNDDISRQMYLALLQSFIRRDIIQNCGINYYNNTCKDAIDRGAIHTFFDVYWTLLMNGKERDHTSLRDLTVLTSFPAFAAKKQAILDDRINVILKFAQKIGGNQNSLGQMISSGLSIDQKSALRNAWSSCSLKRNWSFQFDKGEPREISIDFCPSNFTPAQCWNQFYIDAKRARPNSFMWLNQDLKKIFDKNEKIEFFLGKPRFEKGEIAEFTLNEKHPVANLVKSTFAPVRDKLSHSISHKQFEERLSFLLETLSQTYAAEPYAFNRAYDLHKNPFVITTSIKGKNNSNGEVEDNGDNLLLPQFWAIEKSEKGRFPFFFRVSCILRFKCYEPEKPTFGQSRCEVSTEVDAVKYFGDSQVPNLTQHVAIYRENITE